MTKPLILITGATGTVGREVVKQLVEAGARVRALVRSPDKATKLGENVDVVPGDLEKLETLAPAFAGVEKALVLSLGPQLATMEGNAYDAAKKTGVRHIVKLSERHVDADFMYDMPLARWHRDSEQRLRSLGIQWTIVLPGTFASNFLEWLDRKRMGIFLPVGKGKDTFIDPRDIGAVIVKALTTPGHAGAIYEITSHEWFDYAEAASKLSVAIGRPVTFTDAPEAPVRDGLAAAGLHSGFIESILRYFAAIKNGTIYKPTSWAVPPTVLTIGHGRVLPRFYGHLIKAHNGPGGVSWDRDESFQRSTSVRRWRCLTRRVSA